MRLFTVYFVILFFSGHLNADTCKLRKSVSHLIDTLDSHKCEITGKTDKLQVDHIVEVQAVRHCYEKHPDTSTLFCDKVELWLNTKQVSFITLKAA